MYVQKYSFYNTLISSLKKTYYDSKLIYLFRDKESKPFALIGLVTFINMLAFLKTFFNQCYVTAYLNYLGKPNTEWLGLEFLAKRDILDMSEYFINMFVVALALLTFGLIWFLAKSLIVAFCNKFEYKVPFGLVENSTNRSNEFTDQQIRTIRYLSELKCKEILKNESVLEFSNTDEEKIKFLIKSELNDITQEVMVDIDTVTNRRILKEMIIEVLDEIAEQA